MSLPNAYIIGAQKAGTTSLHNWLGQHPDIYGPEHLKDVDYLANPQKACKAKDLLEADFKNHKGETIVLHSQVNYMFYPSALQKIKEITPQAKLILVLRNPEDRAVSAYRYFKKMGREERLPEPALLYEPQKKIRYSHDNNDFTYMEHGFYAQQLKQILEIFEKDQLMVISFKELKSSPEEVLHKIFTFLKVDPGFKPNLKTQNTTGEPAIKWLHQYLTKSSKTRKKVMNVFVDWWMPVKKRQLLRRKLIDTNTTKKQPISKDDFKARRIQVTNATLS